MDEFNQKNLCIQVTKFVKDNIPPYLNERFNKYYCHLINKNENLTKILPDIISRKIKSIQCYESEKHYLIEKKLIFMNQIHHENRAVCCN